MKKDAKIKSGLPTSGIARKFFIYLMLFSILPLIFIGIASYELATKAITDQAVKFAQNAVDHQRDILDLQLDRVENLMSDIAGVEEISKALGQDSDTISTFTDLATKARIGYILNGYLSLEGLVSLDIYTLDGVHYHVGETLDAEDIRENVKSRILEETSQSRNFIYWAGIEQNINKRSPEQQVLTAASIISEINRTTLEQRNLALLVANYSIGHLTAGLKKTTADGGSYSVLLDDKNRIILHPDASLIGQQSSPELVEFLHHENEADTVVFLAEEMVVTSASFGRTGWKIGSFIPLAVLTKPASDIGIYSLALLALCLAVVSFTAYRYSSTVVEPIRRVIEAFKAFEKGTLDANEMMLPTGKKEDEITELSRWYNSFLKVVRQQKEVQDALLDSENRFKDFAEASSDWFWETDIDHKITFVSDRFFEHLDMTREEIYGKSRITVSEDFNSSVDKLEWEKHLRDLNEHKPFRLNFPVTDHTGKVMYIQSSGKPVFGEGGEFMGYRGTGTDITKGIRAEKALLDMNKTLEDRVLKRTTAVRVEKERAERLVAAIHILNEAVAIFDAGDCLIFCNKKFASLHENVPQAIEYGVSFSQHCRLALLNKLVPEAIGEEEKWLRDRMDHHRKPVKIFEQSWTGGASLLIHEQRLPDGGTIIMASDVTERKQLEEQVRRAQKMDAIGQLTGGIAHDFNNILGIIQGNLELLYDGPLDSTYRKFLENAQKGIYRGADITRKLLAFSRKDVRKVELAQLSELISDIEELISRSLTAYIKVETNLAEDLWPVNVDIGDFEDAILNLSINARDAMPDGGTLSIGTENKVLDEDYTRLNPQGKTGHFVMVSVGDTGTGMDVETRERVFEPFFTTKEPGKGTGLGLSMVYGFAQRSGGHLQVYTEIGRGTTFRIFFPKAEGLAAEQSVKIGKNSNLRGGSETVLVVEDEPELREIAASHLKRLGYNILEAENGDKALQLISQANGIDLVFSDVVMPGKLDGYQLATSIHHQKPKLKVLLASGFNKTQAFIDNDAEDYLVILNNQLLSKPYDKRELSEAIRNKLDE